MKKMRDAIVKQPTLRVAQQGQQSILHLLLSNNYRCMDIQLNY
jgi:hypothetical protein